MNGTAVSYSSLEEGLSYMMSVLLSFLLAYILSTVSG
jgi:hypothetical protein